MYDFGVQAATTSCVERQSGNVMLLMRLGLLFLQG